MDASQVPYLNHQPFATPTRHCAGGKIPWGKRRGQVFVTRGGRCTPDIQNGSRHAMDLAENGSGAGGQWSGDVTLTQGRGDVFNTKNGYRSVRWFYRLSREISAHRSARLCMRVLD